MNTRRALFSILIAALPFASGCVWTPSLNHIKDDIARQIPGATFDKEMSIAIGPGAIALARGVASFIPPAQEARAWLKDVSRVEIAVYDVQREGPAGRIETPPRIRAMVDEGWELAARVRERDESTWVLYRIDDDSVRELFVLSLDDHELVMVKVKGRLERVLARALSEREVWPHSGRYRDHQS